MQEARESATVQSMIYLGNGIVVLGDANGGVSLSVDYSATWKSYHFDAEIWMSLVQKQGKKEPLSDEEDNLLRKILDEAHKMLAGSSVRRAVMQTEVNRTEAKRCKGLLNIMDKALEVKMRRIIKVIIKPIALFFLYLEEVLGEIDRDRAKKRQDRIYEKVRAKYYGDIVFGDREMELTREERLIWRNLVALASASRNPGVIQPDDKPKLAVAFGVPLKLLEQSLAKFSEQGRITENEHGITIVNWQKYTQIDNV